MYVSKYDFYILMDGVKLVIKADIPNPLLSIVI